MSAGNGGRTPWQDQLESTFEDEETRQQVDDFLRGSVQPYVTQLEQRTQVPDEAQRLYNDLSENPGETYVSLTAEMFGDDVAERIVELINAGESPAEATAQATEEAATTAPTGGLTPEQEQVIEWAQQKAQAEAYDEMLANVKEAHPDVVEELFHPFVAMADGDPELAYQGYQRYMAAFREANGLSNDEEALEVLDADGNVVTTTTPPPAMNSSTPGGSGDTPVQRKQTMDEAMFDFVNQDLKKAPPVLGTV